MRPLTLEEAGLPRNSSIVQLLYNAAAKQTIAEVQLGRSSPIHRLYWRNAGQSPYSLLGTPAEDQSLESAVTCDAPFVFVRVVEWRPSQTGALGGRTLGIWRADLGASPLVAAVDLSDMLPANAHISRVLRANDTGTELVVVVMFPKGAPGRYSICTLDLVNKRYVEHDTLPGI